MNEKLKERLSTFLGFAVFFGFILYVPISIVYHKLTDKPKPPKPVLTKAQKAFRKRQADSVRVYEETDEVCPYCSSHMGLEQRLYLLRVEDSMDAEDESDYPDYDY